MQIAVANTKGGVGKTATSMMFAWLMARRGQNVEVRDLDPSSSATRWADKAEEAGEPLPFPVTMMHSTMLYRPSLADISIVDTAPSNKADLANAVEYSDFIIIPAAPGANEVDRTLETIKHIDLNKCAVLITFADHTKSTQLLRDALADQVSLFDTEIRRTEALRRTYGTLPKKDFGYADALNELDQLFNEIGLAS